MDRLADNGQAIVCALGISMWSKAWVRVFLLVVPLLASAAAATAFAAKDPCKKKFQKLCPLQRSAENASTKQLQCLKKHRVEFQDPESPCHAPYKKKLRRLSARAAVDDHDAAVLSWPFGLLIALGLLLIGWWQFAFYRLLNKANYPGWYAFIPAYNIYFVYRLAGVPPWWFALSLSPALIILWPKTCLAFAESFGQSQAFGWGLALLPFVYFPILAFTPEIYFEGRGDLPSIDFDLKI